jgi:hypothetical protein
MIRNPLPVVEENAQRRVPGENELVKVSPDDKEHRGAWIYKIDGCIVEVEAGWSVGGGESRGSGSRWSRG